MRDTCRPSAWMVSSSVRRPWMCAMAAPALTASMYCCATPGMSSCGGQRWVCGLDVREATATVMISFSMTAPERRFACLVDCFNLVAACRADDGVEHRHAVQHVVDRHRIGTLVANAARELGHLGMQHVEARMLGDLVGRRR